MCQACDVIYANVRKKREDLVVHIFFQHIAHSVVGREITWMSLVGLLVNSIDQALFWSLKERTGDSYHKSNFGQSSRLKLLTFRVKLISWFRSKKQNSFRVLRS